MYAIYRWALYGSIVQVNDKENGNSKRDDTVSDKDRSFIIRLAAVAIVIAMLAMVSTLLAGLFNPAVDNDKVFQILGPMSNQISGALISVLSALTAVKFMGKGDDDGSA